MCLKSQPQKLKFIFHLYLIWQTVFSTFVRPSTLKLIQLHEDSPSCHLTLSLCIDYGYLNAWLCIDVDLFIRSQRKTFQFRIIEIVSDEFWAPMFIHSCLLHTFSAKLNSNCKKKEKELNVLLKLDDQFEVFGNLYWRIHVHRLCNIAYTKMVIFILRKQKRNFSFTVLTLCYLLCILWKINSKYCYRIFASIETERTDGNGKKGTIH